MFAIKVIGTIIIVLVGIGVSGFIGTILGKKKIDVDSLVAEAKKAMPVFDNVTAVVESLLPTPYKDIAVTVVTVIQKAIATAEGMAKAGQLPEPQRKTYATSLINSGLMMEGVKTDDEDVQKVVSLAVDLSVKLFLPKTHKAVTAATASVQQYNADPAAVATGSTASVQ